MFGTEFLLTSLIVVLIPGTGVIYTVSSGIFLGKRASLAAACGCTLGIVPHLTASILGLSAILHMSALAFQTLKYAGALYLLYLSFCMFKDSGQLKINSKFSTKKLGSIAAKGFLINILNPKLSIFFLAFMPLFIAPDAASPMLQMAGMSLVFMLMTLVIFILYGLSAGSVSKYIVSSPKNAKYLQRTFAAMLAAFGVKLALTE